MSRSRTILLAVAVIAFLAGGGYLAFRGTGGGGAAVSLDLRVTGGTMTPDNPTARQGDTVTLTITADRDEEVHLHGYDIAFDCKAGRPLSKTFKADKSGDFELEIETPSAALGKLTVKP